MKKLFVLTSIVIIVILGGAYFWWQMQLTPVDSSNKSQEIFVVQQGDTIHIIADNLEKAGLIKNATAFRTLVKLQKLDNNVQSGDFRLSPSMSLETIANNLTHGSMDYWVTIPEGKRAEEIA